MEGGMKPVSPTGVEPVTFGSGENFGTLAEKPKYPVQNRSLRRPGLVARAGEHDPRFAKIFGISAPCAEDSARISHLARVAGFGL
jgi:hypothetical protein